MGDQVPGRVLDSEGLLLETCQNNNREALHLEDNLDKPSAAQVLLALDNEAVALQVGSEGRELAAGVRSETEVRAADVAAADIDKQHIAEHRVQGELPEVVQAGHN